MASFDDLGLSSDLLRAVANLGYEEPSPIQTQAIPALLSGADVIAQAQTGTGKTAAFAIPLVQGVEQAASKLQGLVIVPTRELALQVAEAIHGLGRTRGLSVVPIYGGQPYDRQLRALRSGVQVAVGTPGRLLDHLRRGSLDLDAVKLLVLDEADEMLDMGFLEDIELILDAAPAGRQTAMFSATVPPRIDSLARRYLRDPQRISIHQETQTAPQTRQYIHQVPYRGKLDALIRILDFEAPRSAMIFCRTRREVDELREALQARGYMAAAIHGDIAQAQREQQLRAFREGRAEILVATDVAARGLDIPDVSHVINYDIPEDADAYVHRVGRTGRMGRAGEAITFVTPRETRLLKAIEAQTHKKLKPLKLPTLEQIAARREELLVDSLKAAIAARQGDNYRKTVEALGQEYEPMEIAAAALALAATDGGGRDAARSTSAGAPEGGQPPPAPAGEHGMVRLFMSAGRKQGLGPSGLIRELAEQAGVAASAVGTIDLYDSFAFLEVKPGAAKRLTERDGVVIGGLPVRFKRAHARSG